VKAYSTSQRDTAINGLINEAEVKMFRFADDYANGQLPTLQKSVSLYQGFRAGQDSPPWGFSGEVHAKLKTKLHLDLLPMREIALRFKITSDSISARVHIFTPRRLSAVATRPRASCLSMT
jgi:hypothetical protein